MRLLIARHGATQNNLEARLTGQSDVPLSLLGERQAQALADSFMAIHLDAVISSDLQRALVTAETIARLHSVEVTRDPDLREISVGSWSERGMAEIRANEHELVTRWEADPIHVAPPGGETVAELRDRAARALDRWHAAYPLGDVLWVTHGGFIAILLCHALGMDLARRWQFRRDNASITELDVTERGVVLARLNDISHLHGVTLATEGERAQLL